jgi:hypothetical protein
LRGKKVLGPREAPFPLDRSSDPPAAEPLRRFLLFDDHQPGILRLRGKRDHRARGATGPFTRRPMPAAAMATPALLRGGGGTLPRSHPATSSAAKWAIPTHAPSPVTSASSRMHSHRRNARCRLSPAGGMVLDGGCQLGTTQPVSGGGGGGVSPAAIRRRTTSRRSILVTRASALPPSSPGAGGVPSLAKLVDRRAVYPSTLTC